MIKSYKRTPSQTGTEHLLKIENTLFAYTSYMNQISTNWIESFSETKISSDNITGKGTDGLKFFCKTVPQLRLRVSILGLDFTKRRSV